ncbi:MAG: hypothetical protein ISEC1_P0490 [Thiomicrorhabdus sp.]|nr:MAG: hypothetical protein ISEC1_P0490 [Thiomicrorhabdus sp.]
MSDSKFRLITRSDFDGLVCAVLFKELDMIDSIKFVHPKDMQDNIVEISESDITTNLPYVEGCHLSFDHHLSESIRNNEMKNHIIDIEAPSAARVVYDYYGGKEAFPRVGDDLMEAVDKADAAQFSRDEILSPKGWPLLNFLMDARTGLGRFREFKISNYQLMMELIDYCRDHTIDEILALPDVKERVDLYFNYERDAKKQLNRCTRLYKNLAVIDFKDEEIIYPINRFTIYAMYPEINISIHVLWGLKKQNTVYAIGKSILDRSSKTNVGELCLKYGGGGHIAAGTCQIDNNNTAVLVDLISKINNDG